MLGFLLGKFTQDCRHSIFESKAKLVNGCAHFVAHQALGAVEYSYHLGKIQVSIDDGNIRVAGIKVFDLKGSKSACNN